MGGLKLYGFMVSQPTRAAAWLLKAKGIPFEFVQVAAHKGETKTPEFLKMNPNGFVPVIQDGDFSLYEGAAILTYLAEKYALTDVPDRRSPRTRQDPPVLALAPHECAPLRHTSRASSSHEGAWRRDV